MKFGLTNIRTLLNSVENPHQHFPAIHVAGTNGKGSTSSMIAAIFTAAGYKVGLYTSPHLEKFNERIRINGGMISDRDVIRYVDMLRSKIEMSRSTFFEATTAIAFKYFADRKVDIAVIETGLGGRLDSTNVITPIVSVITTIGKDHTEYLGNTFRQIAFEKAGIIKHRVPVVLGAVDGIARKVILNIARTKKSSLLYSSRLTLPENIQIELKGDHQVQNAKNALAAVTLTEKRFLIGNEAIKTGLEKTTKLSGLRGRLEHIEGRPEMILDVAHNPEGIISLVRALKDFSHKNKVLLFSVMKDKDYLSMLYELKKVFEKIVIIPLKMERALPEALLGEFCKKIGFKVYEAKSASDGLEYAIQRAGKNGLVVVSGSNYLIGEILPLISRGKK
jgi:dihydrofolate synthase/folylpolyglutamate synthase